MYFCINIANEELASHLKKLKIIYAYVNLIGPGVISLGQGCHRDGLTIDEFL